MEAKAETSDGSDTEQYNSTSEEQSASDNPLDTSSELPLSSLVESFHSGSEETLLNSSCAPLNSSCLSSWIESERSSSRNSAKDSSLAHPLSISSDSQCASSQDPSVSEVPELPLNRLIDSHDDSSSDNSLAAETDFSNVIKDKVNKRTQPGFFKTAKFDILQAMKAEVCKVSETKVSKAIESEVPTKTEIKTERGSGEVGTNVNGETKAQFNEERGAKAEVNKELAESQTLFIKEKADKVNEETEAEVNEESKAKVNEESKAKVNEESKAKVNDETEAKVIEESEAEVIEESEAEVIEESEAKVNEETEAKVNEETEDKVNEETEDKVNEETEDKVNEETEAIVNEETEAIVNEETEAIVNKETETEVNKETEIEVNEETVTEVDEETVTEVDEETVTEVDEETVTEVDEETVTEVDEETKAEGNEETKPKVSEVTETEVNSDTEGEVNKKAKAKVNEEFEVRKAKVNKTKDDVVNSTKEDYVEEVIKAVAGKASETEISEAEDVTKSVKTDFLESMQIEVDERIEDKVDRDMETKEIDIDMERVESKKHEKTEELNETEVEPRNAASEDCMITEPGTSKTMEIGMETQPGTSKTMEDRASKRSHEEEEQMEFGCNEDSRGETDGILREEAKRLDQLNLPSQVTPEPDAPDGEEEREKQYKKLVDLLSKSKFYTDVLLKKVEADVEKYSRKRKHPDSAKNGNVKEENQCDSPSKQGSPSKKKKILMENQRAMYQIASEVMKNKNQDITKEVDASAVESQSTADVKPAEQIKQPNYLSGGTLRDYQLEGFNWLKVLYENGVNGILADEMGLGKTVQVIALLSHLIEMKIRGPFLIVGPLSTLPNWMIEFKRFAPQLHVVLFYGTKTERRKMSETLMKRKNVNGVMCYPIVVTSYEVPVFERGFMSRLKWKYIIVDEGHKIKNYNTLLAKVLRTFKSANRLLLTGTPLQNSLSELWSLLNFLVPEIFDNLDVFESWFRIEELSDDAGRMKIIEEERRKKVLSTLHQILAPFMLRRVKSEVTLDIPKKKEVLVKAPMTEMQLKLYQALLDKNIGFLKKIEIDDLIIPDVNGKRPKRSCTRGKNYEEKSDPDTLESFKEDADDEQQDVDIEAIITYYIRVRMLNPHVALKQIANHPYLIHYPLQKDGRSLLIDESVVKSSGKFLVLDAMLERLHAKGHKVLVFSTLCMLLDVVEDYLSLRSYSYERLDGNVRISDRADAIQRFNSDPNIFLFLLSTRAGGLGVNLTGADTVIFLDSDWNPQADLQAQDRCHRIGQTKPVMVYRLVTTGTIEEQILKRASAKRVLEKMVICKGTSIQKEFDLEELKSILESRDHSEIVYTDGQVLTDQQLEKLLDRSDLLQ